ncbi:unnamed protein product, partial [Effrenium voratum]
SSSVDVAAKGLRLRPVMPPLARLRGPLAPRRWQRIAGALLLALPSCWLHLRPLRMRSVSAAAATAASPAKSAEEWFSFGNSVDIVGASADEAYGIYANLR